MDLFPRIAVSSATFRDEALPQALERLRRLGFRQMELCAIPDYCDHFDPLLVDVGDEECYLLRDQLTAQQLSAVSVAGYPANPLDRGLRADDWYDMIYGYVHLAQVLGARTLVLPPGGPAPEPGQWRGELEHAKPWIRDAARRAITAHIIPALAMTRGSLLSSSKAALDYLQVMGVVGLGLAIDTAELALMGEDPARAIRTLGSAVALVMLRDTDGRNANLPPGDGHLDFAAIMTALQDTGYDGPLVLSIDDVGQAPDARADALWRGWLHLDGMSLSKAA